MTFRASECIKKRSGAEDPNNWLSNIQRCKQGRSFSHGLRSIGETPGTNQGLVMAKSWLPKKELTIPLLELLAGQMATYLAQNIKEVLEGFRVRTVYGWLDTSVTLHWIHGNRKCKQLVRNWVRNIQVKQINCRHVPTEENPRDSQMCGVGEEMLTDWELFGGRDQAGYHNHRTGHKTL